VLHKALHALLDDSGCSTQHTHVHAHMCQSTAGCAPGPAHSACSSAGPVSKVTLLRRPLTQSISAEDEGVVGMPPSGSVRRLEAGVQGGSQPGAGQGAAQGLSTEALHSMYTQCLKLAAENKITQKNTWDLSIVMDQARRTRRTYTVPA